ncbi:mitochondrial fusion protein (Ugo1) [Blumeria hordei DH14]|uniref:Mitochondrial fusion protein (Ugo1) n=1 Tax=Blumeria graminis f. sp. hordei (strain DH14) TaxID=546991 RepID=N1JJI2_BLUG1|nr:mitochondrial fusion protein (Ugo1) [Blumeria hordei DH14]
MSIQEPPNPLRPYYRPPSIGISQPSTVTTLTTHGLGPNNGNASSYASSARDIFSEIDYKDYLSKSSPSSLESIKCQVDEWLYRYVGTLFAQPFDVAKIILQARPFKNRNRGVTNPKPNPPPSYQLALKTTGSVLEVISQEWSKEGAWGVWKGSNITFVHGILFDTLEKWLRGLMSAILNLPETGLSSGLEIPAEFSGLLYPYTSLALSLSAGVMAGVILAPIDLIRTKVMLTPTSVTKRSLVSQFRMLNSYLCPSALLIPTILHSIVTPAIVYSTPTFLRSHLSIDPLLTPGSYQIARLVSRMLELCIKLPMEIVLRRAQISFIKKGQGWSNSQGSHSNHISTTVPVGDYRGVFGTMWLIVNEEGTREVSTSGDRNKKTKIIKGQGLSGLWRGWRVGMWGIVGLWGARILNGSNGNIGEF